MANLKLHSVKKTYDQKNYVLHGVDIDIEDGEFVVIVGPSGCGKSTLLRMVAGLESVSEGSILIGSQVVNQLEPKDRNIAMVFQNYALYPHMDVRQNMSYGLKIRGIDKKTIDELVDGTNALVGNSITFHPLVQTISTSLVYRFNWGGPVVGGFGH